MRYYIVFIISFISILSFSQKNDSSYLKNNFIYVNPFFFSNDILELHDYWVSVGYDRKINKKIITGINISTIVTSKPSTGLFYGPGFNAKKSNGIRLNIEVKYLINKVVYVSANIFHQATKTDCEEEVLNNSGITPIIYKNDYFVNRTATSLIPKIGFLFLKKNKHLYIDLNFGFGLKYINSHTISKIGNLSTKKESYSGKSFEYGNKFTYHPLIHLKIGYNF